MDTRETIKSRIRLGSTFLLGGLLLVLMAAGNTQGDCVPTEPQHRCESNADCSGVPPVDCEGGWLCDEGRCRFVCAEELGGRCLVDSNCPTGAVCRIDETGSPGICVFEPGLPPPPPYEACLGDSDCAEGYVCDTSDCLSCCPNAGPDEACIMACCGRCIPAATPDPEPDPDYRPCMSDADCGPGGYCITSDCLSCCPGAGPDVPCIAACCGKCVEAPDPDPARCESDADCADGICVDGRCTDDPPPPYEACMSAADCGPGGYCDTSRCLSCCPDADPGEPCIDACCGMCLYTGSE